MTTEHTDTSAWCMETMRRNNIDPTKAMAFLTKHYLATQAPAMVKVVENFLAEIELKGTGHTQLRHLRTSLYDFVAKLNHDRIELVIEQEIRDWLKRWDGSKPKTWNDKLGYVKSLLLYAIDRKYISTSPAVCIKNRRMGDRKIPEVLDPTEAAALMHWLEECAPEWVPYFAFCLFAGVRPYLRHGEAGRLHGDIMGGQGALKKSFNPHGFFVRGKNKQTRFCRWENCGPLRAWLAVYPYTGGLIPPGLSISQAERRLKKIRAKFNLSHNVLRHTAASAAIHVPGASFAQLSEHFENSEKMLLRHYSGVWWPERTIEFYAIKPKMVPVALRAVA